MTPEQRADVLAQMRESDDVKLRDIGVIAGWLVELMEHHGLDDMGIDAIEAAKSLIRAQSEAGLATFVVADLTAFIGGLRYPVDHGGDSGAATHDGPADRADAPTSRLGPGRSAQPSPGVRGSGETPGAPRPPARVLPETDDAQ